MKAGVWPEVYGQLREVSVIYSGFQFIHFNITDRIKGDWILTIAYLSPHLAAGEFGRDQLRIFFRSTQRPLGTDRRF